MTESGVPRAGKSIVSHRLAKLYGYQHISMDSIIAGFEKCFPETGVNTCAGLSSMDTLHLISGKMAPFIRAMLNSGEFDEFQPGMVLNMYQLLPEDCMKYIHGVNCEIFYFITSDVTLEEWLTVFRNCRILEIMVSDPERQFFVNPVLTIDIGFDAAHVLRKLKMHCKQPADNLLLST